MSFAIIHMQKIKTGGIRGIENHNERLKESKTNPDINPEKSNLNKTLHNENNDKTYYNRVKERIKELQLPKAVRKDAVTMCGFVCTSDKEFFDKLPQIDQDRFFKESHDFLKDRYGEKNIIASTVHYDEKTPHLHCYIVPVTEDGRLSAKDIFTRTELRKLQTDYHSHINQKGFDLERGISTDGKRKHIDTQELKIQTKQKEIENIKTELDITQDKLKIDFKAVQDTRVNLCELERLEVKKSFIGSKITLSEKDYNKLVDIAKQGIHNSNKVKDLEIENINMKNDSKGFRDGANKLVNIISELKEENKNLRKENKSIKKDLKNLKEQDKAMYETLENHGVIHEAKDKLKTMREAQKVSEKVLKKTLIRGFDMER